ncbi:eEF1A lysine and N-terminal methyltransferase isoform X2 [Procambarus clarkii]
MHERYSSDCPDMKWMKMDITASSFQNEEFTCVLDKATLDALMTDGSSEVVSLVNKYFDEMSRVLRVGGRYVCVTLLQAHILEHVLNWFPKNGWIMRICRCEDAEKSQAESGNFSFPVFVLVCTKFRHVDNFKQVIEVELGGEGVHRVESTQEVVRNIQQLQQFSLLRHTLHSQHIAGEDTSVELCDPKTGGVRYVLHIVDSLKKSNSLKFAVFIVPHGREHEWMFGSQRGREKLAESAGARRLVVVHLMRGQTYHSLQGIQEELSARVMELAPSALPSNTKIPFLSVGEDLGSRKEVTRGQSQYSGDYLVEDVQPPGASKLRRLIFLANQNVVQSEAKLITVKEKKKKGGVKEKVSVDYSFLSCEHHVAMVGGMGLVELASDLLLVGLGGGPLATYIHKYFPKVTVTAVDIDPSMVHIAQKWFGFVPNSRLKVEINDGIKYIQSAAADGTKFNVIMFDVDSKDSTVGMSCPPQAFIEISFLEVVSSCLKEGGVLIVNLVCRDVQLKKKTLEDVKSVFPVVLCQQIPEEVNCVLFCLLSGLKRPEKIKLRFEKGLRTLNESLKQQQKTNEDIFSFSEITENLTIV